MAGLQTRIGKLAKKCRPLLKKLRPLWVRSRALMLLAHRRIRIFFDQEPGVRVLAASAGAGTTDILRPTCTFTDTGLWFRQSRIRTVCIDTGLLLLAPGRRPCIQQIPFTQLGKSMYNAVTGELLLEPAPEASVRRLKMDPAAGRELMEEIIKKGEP